MKQFGLFDTILSILTCLNYLLRLSWCLGISFILFASLYGCFALYSI